MEEKEEKDAKLMTNNSPSITDSHDFIYVDETSSMGSNGEIKSNASTVSKKSSNGNSYVDINDIEHEHPKLEPNNHNEDISKLVADAAQISDFYPNYFDDENHRAHSDTGHSDSSSNDEEDNASVKRCPSESHARDACVLFHGITYLGSGTINAPVSELELRRTISILRDNTEVSIDVILGVTLHPSGDIRLIDPETRTDIAAYSICNILYWGKGDSENREKDCFAFNITHGREDATFQCHVFKCQEEDQVVKIIQSIAQTVKRDKKRKQIAFPLRRGSNFDPSNLTFKFNLQLDIWEADGKGSYQQVPRDKNHFKLRCQLQKKIVVYIEQTSNSKLRVERCFGLLAAPGRDIKGEDMHLLQQVGMEQRPFNKIVVQGHWDPNLEYFKLLNTDTGKDNKLFMTVAVDLVFHDLKEPLRFVKEFKVRVFGTHEKFWSPTKPKIVEEYILQLKENFTDLGEKFYETESLKSATDISKLKALQNPLAASRVITSRWKTSKEPVERRESQTSEIEEIQSPEEEDLNEEALLSGSGLVEQEFSEQDLSSWSETLQKWQETGKKPQKLDRLIRKGIPEAIRGQIWMMLVGVEDEDDLVSSYAYLLNKESRDEQVILWDVTRTFPAHDYFKDAGGQGQTALYKISKAYSVYDEEVGYCQGLSFLIASFLLHVPEEQAYCLLVKTMFKYGHRDLYKESFEMLHQAFFVLEHLMEDFLQDLYLHFRGANVEAHMFASQWFLTLFTAKFPLSLVNHIIDIILFEGTDAIFQIALALLKDSKKELLAQDFEGILKYFRVSLPKRYMLESHRKDLIQTAYSFKISKKRLEKYKQDYFTMKEELEMKEDPITRLQRENQRLIETNMRLEHASDNLAYEIVTTQVTMQEIITDREEKLNNMTKESERMRKHLMESEEEIERLKIEEARIKELWRDSMKVADDEKNKRDRIIDDYKHILSRVESSNEASRKSLESEVSRLQQIIKKCEGCSEFLISQNNSESRNDASSSHDDGSSQLIEPNDVEKQLRDIENELVQTKLALAEEKNRADELEMRLTSTINAEKPWYKKVTMNSKR